ANTSATSATSNSEPTMRVMPGRRARSEYSPAFANSRTVSRKQNGRNCSVPCTAWAVSTLPLTASLSSSAVKIASETPAKSSASRLATRAARRSVEKRSRKDSAVGRLARTSRSGGGELGAGRLATIGAVRRGSLGAEGPLTRGGEGLDVPDKRVPISPLTTPSGGGRSGAVQQSGRGLRRTAGRSARPSSDQHLDARVLDRAPQPLAQRHLGRPVERLLGEADVGAALLGVVHGERLEHDL